jgi:N-acetylglucosaminyl-diphospho-decaprenol L-rhamnosyltransferase
MMLPPASLGVAIVNYHSADDVHELIGTLARCGVDDALTVLIAVVDNSEQPDNLEPALDRAARAGFASTLISGKGNVGYAGGNNLAANWLLAEGAEVIWVLNPDTRVTPCDLRRVAEMAAAGRAVAATTLPGSGAPDTGCLDLWTGRSAAVPGATGDRRRLAYAAGHSLVVTGAAWRELDGLSEAYFLFYEEADLAVRCQRHGIPLTRVPGVSVVHERGASTGSSDDLRSKSRVTYFHASRSCMIFFRTHRPWRLPVALLARLGYAARVLLAAGPRPAGAILRGALSGLVR